MAQQKPGVMLYFELRPSLRRLSSRERLALYDAIMDYGEWGVVPDFTGKLAVAWDFVQPKLDRDDEAYLRNVQQRRYALYARECKRDGAEPLSYKEWRVSKDSEAERPTSGDNGSYPSTNSNPNSNPDPNPNPNPDPTSCCYDNAAGKPPRQPQRLIPPTVEEVRAYAAQRGDFLDPEAFMDYYTANGWKVGRNPMKDWKAAVRTWARKEQAHGAGIRSTDPATATDAAAERYGVHL